MPKIPRKKQQQILQPSTARTTSARGLTGPGKQLQNLGGAVGSFGKSLSQFQKRRQVNNQTNNKLLREAIKQKIREEASQADHFARTNPNKAQDGSTLVKDFDRKLEPLRKEIEATLDGTAKQMARNIFRDITNSKRDKLRELSREEKDVFQKEKIDEFKRKASARVSADPDPENAEEEIESLENYVDGLNLVKQDAKAVKNDLSKEMAMASINSLVQNNEFDAAREAIDDKFGKYLTASEQRQTKNYIDNQEIAKEDREYKLEQREKKRKEDRLKKIQRRNEIKFLKKLENASTAEERDKLHEQMFQAARNRQVSRNFVDAFTKDVSQADDDASKLQQFYLRDDLFRGDTENFGDRIYNKVKNEEMNPVDGKQILEDYIQVIQSSNKSDTLPSGQTATSYFEERIKPLLEEKRVLGSTFYPSAEQRIKNYAEDRFIKHWKRTGEPVKATKTALAETFGAIRTLENSTIPGIDPDNQDKDIETVMKNLKRRTVALKRWADKVGGYENLPDSVIRGHNRYVEQVNKRLRAERLKEFRDFASGEGLPPVPLKIDEEDKNSENIESMIENMDYLDPDSFSKSDGNL